jgi:hypothetical protein
VYYAVPVALEACTYIFLSLRASPATALRAEGGFFMESACFYLLGLFADAHDR